MNQIVDEPSVSSRNAVLHDAVRPAWTPEVTSWLLGSPPEDRTLKVLDLGSGTGLGTRAIATLGHCVTAVDTSEDMLTVLRKSCEQLPPATASRITTASGSAENIPLDDQSVDAITCLQAWHWIDPELALPECDRVLSEDGMMSMAWHTWDRSSDWVKELAAIVEPEGTPPDQTRSIPPEFAGRGTFERKEFPFSYELSLDQLVGLASSWAFVAQRPDRGTVLERIRSLGEQAMSPETGLVSFPHITAAFRLRRINLGITS